MNIVSNSNFLRNLRNLDFFELDLGKSIKMPGKDEFRKLDDFVIRYQNLYETRISKFGKIGNRIIFYEDFTMNDNIYLIFNNDDIYEIEYSIDDIKDLKNYILETLRRIDEIDNYEKTATKKNEKSIDEIVQNNDYWIAEDEKNSGKTYLIDQRLSKEDYRKEMERLFHTK